MKKLLFLILISLVSCNITPSNRESKKVDEPKDLLSILVRSYESENAIAFLRHIGISFQATGVKGDPINSVSLKTSVRDDFKLLDRIRFTISVGAVQKISENEVKMNLRWDRSAVIEETSAKWVVRNQTSELLLEKTDNGWKLNAVLLDPLFGLSDTSGTITIDRGEVDGQRITIPIAIN